MFPFLNATLKKISDLTTYFYNEILTSRGQNARAFLATKGIVDINDRKNNPNGYAPLHQAIADGDREIVEALIIAGADLNLNALGRTVLYKKQLPAAPHLFI